MPIVLMGLIVGVLAWLLQLTTAQAVLVNRSLVAIAQAEKVLAVSIDSGDGYLNYELTGDPVFLRAYDSNELKIPGELATLRTLAGTSPQMAAREEQIEDDLKQWTGAQPLVPPVLDSGPKSVRLLVNLKLNQLRGDVGSFVLGERQQLDAEGQRQRASAIFLFAALGGSAFLAAFILSFQSWRTIRTLSNRYEQALAEVTEKSAALARSNAELDQRVEERTKELHLVNQELELFSSSAAHDLRAPLRSIVASTRMFMEDYGSLVPKEGLNELRRVGVAATRLSNVIDGLLEMARLGRTSLTLSEVDLSELCNQSVTEIRSRDWSGPVTVTIEPDMRVRGDPILLSLLIQNLIENAFKFCCTTGDGRVDILAERKSLEVIVSVRDNGVGFDDSFADKLFKPFERLHSDSEFSGTGMGLANAKRVVDRHGGRIWAESRPGAGATFRFALPAPGTDARGQEVDEKAAQ